MDSIPRQLRIRLPQRKSSFLWGPRRTGKSTYLRDTFPTSLRYDLLETDLALELAKRPALLREQLLARPKRELARPIILDEVQKVPGLLDEVHGLIESHGLRFLMCGSSARKLRRGQGNLLGGRAWRFEMLPLTSFEIGEVDLLRMLNHGTVPDHYLEHRPAQSLRSYVNDYLKEEVFAEGLTRNVPAFSRFFDAVGFSHGELVNYSNIARDCGVDSKTVKEYYQILVDTLLGRFVEPYKARRDRQVISRAPKFYLFDVGVAGALTGRRIREPRGEQFGRALEHLVLMELWAHRSYRQLDYPIAFWRTKVGVEVDFVLGAGEVAIEVKGAARVGSRDLRPLRAFCDLHRPRAALIVCNERTERVAGPIRVLPWKVFLDRLWAGRIIR